MQGLYALREILHNRILHLRSIEGMLLGLTFDDLWRSSNNEQREELKKLVSFGNKYKVHDWIKDHPELDIAELPISELRILAKEKHIKNYSRLSKWELLVALKGEDGG